MFAFMIRPVFASVNHFLSLSEPVLYPSHLLLALTEVYSSIITASKTRNWLSVTANTQTLTEKRGFNNSFKHSLRFLSSPILSFFRDLLLFSSLLGTISDWPSPMHTRTGNRLHRVPLSNVDFNYPICSQLTYCTHSYALNPHTQTHTQKCN